jgi:hypothetical protein
MDNVKYIEVYTRNAKMMKLHGDDLTWVEKFINCRSNGLHMELRFSDRYGRISASSTMQDGVNGFRFKMIGYSHGYRWSVIRIPVTAEQEDRIFKEACRMADLQNFADIFYQGEFKGTHTKDDCFYGPNHIKYDRKGVMYSFATNWKIWMPSNKRNWCNESVALLLMEVWPDLLSIKKEDGSITMTYSFTMDSDGTTMDGAKRDYPKKQPHDLLPDETHYLIEYYFRNKS